MEHLALHGWQGGLGTLHGRRPGNIGQASGVLLLLLLQGEPGSKGWNETAAEAGVIYRQSSKVWSAIHSLIHNCRDPMPWEQVQASRSLAVWLRQHFM